MIVDCLIIKKNWLDLILSGKKKMEIRGTVTCKRGMIGVIESGSGEVKGIINLEYCQELKEQDFYNSVHLHRVLCKFSDIPYKNVYGWSIKGYKRFKTPVKYNHPQGAVIWVKVDIPEGALQDGEVD